jgi:hypothetical protein
MKWITRERAKVDRIACPWLISRFLDPSPEFLYVPADRVLVEAARQGAVPYDVAGVELGHQGAFCSFDALLRKYGLEGKDPALDRLALIVRGADTAAKDLAEIFVVLYVTNVLGLSATTFGALVALRMATSILVYLPVATLADRQGRTPFVVASFVCFALFPLLLATAQGTAGLVAAFVCAGLREIGEPARKAMIVDLAEAAQRGRMVGAYYFTRGLVVMPASLIGGLLWQLAPQTPFFVAAGICFLGVILMVRGNVRE